MKTLHAMRRWWLELPEILRAPAWRSAFAALVILALLLGFHQVVTQAVRQGELLRMSTATHAQAVWRCNSLSGSRIRERCRAELDNPPPTRQHDAPPPNTASVDLAQFGR
ncbi:MAG TPA: hypothetical protein VF169_24335 [Albitalea sp.]|uniref:hypothetical protein n=1 Tax=Piscinibacter sp. TaxID=1903157 RepID=UPI002ED32CFA